MATNLTEWNHDIRPFAKRIDPSIIKKAVRDAAIAFCEKTWLWTVNLTRISVVADQQDYALTDPSDAEIIVVDNLKYKENGQDDDQFRNLDPISENQMDLSGSGSWPFAESSSPTGFWVDVVDKILHLYSKPTEASTDGLLVRVVVRPSDGCTSVPDFLYEEHRKTITQGALADLFSQLLIDWPDPEDIVGFQYLLNKANFYENRVEGACNEAKTKKIVGLTKMPLRVKFQSFC